MIQFYSPTLPADPVLGEEESFHCAKVLRKRPDDIIRVTDGRGKAYECRIVKADPKRVEMEVLSELPLEEKTAGRITVAVAPTKNSDRMAWLVEKCVEIGVDRIIFVQCARSERKNVNVERLRRNAISAMNQSLKTRLPEVEGVVKLKDIMGLAGEKVFGYCSPEVERRDFVEVLKPDDDITLLIGPEGDFTPEEVTTLTKEGYVPVTFGDERLRTETAAIYAVSAVHILRKQKKINNSR